MIYRFEQFTLDTLKFTLSNAQGEVAIEPQVFNLIKYLIENRTRLVTRDELFSNLWQGKEVCDTTLSNHIKLARKALGDNGQSQKLIKTIHGRGYQFIAEVIDPIKPQLNSAASFLVNKRYLIIAMVILALLATTFSVFNRRGVADSPPVTANKRIAILPFGNINQDNDNNYLGFALADQIISDLAYLKTITVRPSSTIRKYENAIDDPIKIAHDINVDYVLTGHYLVQNKHIRLNIELINVDTKNLIWQESVKVHYDNIFELQDIVSKKIAKGLNIRFNDPSNKRQYKDIPQHPLAYEYYLRSISYPFTTQGHQMAMEMLEQSILLDPNFAPSYAHLGHHKRLLEQHGRIVFDNNDAEAYYLKALSLNPNLLIALSYLSSFYTETNRIEEAFSITKKMFELNPDNAESHFSLGYIYRYAGMVDEAIAEMEQALAIDPHNSTFRSIVATYISAGKYKKALAALHLDSKSEYQYGYRAIIAIKQKDPQIAVDYFNRVIKWIQQAFGQSLRK